MQDVFDSLREGRWTFSMPITEYLSMAGKIFGSKKPSTKIKKALEFAGATAGLPVIGIERLAEGRPFGGKKEKSLTPKQKTKFEQMEADFDKYWGYKRKRKNTGITE